MTEDVEKIFRKKKLLNVEAGAEGRKKFFAIYIIFYFLRSILLSREKKIYSNQFLRKGAADNGMSTYENFQI